MSIIKELAFVLVLMSIVVELCSLILSKTKFSNLFKTISGMLIIICIISVMSFQNVKIETPKFKYEDNKVYESTIQKNFESNLEEKIKTDLQNKYYVNFEVDVKTNFKKLDILVSGSFDINKNNEIENFIADKYCTAQDEVIVVNENS